MNIKIIKQEPKKLLSREEFYAVIEEEKTTPSHKIVKEEIAKKTGKNSELIIIKKIEQKYGKPEVEVKFYIYQNPEALKKFEVERKTKQAAPAAAEAK